MENIPKWSCGLINNNLKYLKLFRYSYIGILIFLFSARSAKSCSYRSRASREYDLSDLVVGGARWAGLGDLGSADLLGLSHTAIARLEWKTKNIQGQKYLADERWLNWFERDESEHKYALFKTRVVAEKHQRTTTTYHECTEDRLTETGQKNVLLGWKNFLKHGL